MSERHDAPERKAHVWVKDPLSYYIEPRSSSERLFRTLQFRGVVHDPSCGSGRIVRAARAAGYRATGADVVARSPECGAVLDFMKARGRADSIVSNPPFHLCAGDTAPYVRQALKLARYQVALLLPSDWHYADDRLDWLYGSGWAYLIPITPRPSMPPGALIEAGLRPGGGRSNFAWYVWDKTGQPGGPEIKRLSP